MNTEKRVKAEPVSGVVITKIRKVGTDDQTYNLELRQKVLKPIEDSRGLLGFFMQGHSQFGKATQERVCWQNISKDQLLGLKLPVDLQAVDAAGRDGLKFLENPLPFTPTLHGEEIKCQIVEVDTFTPRSWTDVSGMQRVQQPKAAGQGGAILTNGGKAIYANRVLAMQGPGINMSFEDVIIPHDNQIVGSTLAARAAAGNAAGFAASSVANAAGPGAAVIAGQSKSGAAKPEKVGP